MNVSKKQNERNYTQPKTSLVLEESFRIGNVNQDIEQHQDSNQINIGDDLQEIKQKEDLSEKSEKEESDKDNSTKQTPVNTVKKSK